MSYIFYKLSSRKNDLSKVSLEEFVDKHIFAALQFQSFASGENRINNRLISKTSVKNIEIRLGRFHNFIIGLWKEMFLTCVGLSSGN